MLQWGGMVSAAAVAGIMMFAVVTAPESTSFPGSQSLFVANAARRAVPPVDEARGLPAEDPSTYSAPQSYHPPLGWPKNTQLTSPAASRDADPPITGHMR